MTAPPGDGSPYGVFTVGVRPGRGRAARRGARRRHAGSEIAPAHAETEELPGARSVDCPNRRRPAPTRRVPLGTVAGARSGDKGGGANVGVWVRTDEAFAWLATRLTVERFQRLLPETAPLPVTRHVLPNLRALNFVVEGILGEGVASNARHDPQAKALGEWLRVAALVDIPEAFLA